MKKINKKTLIYLYCKLVKQAGDPSYIARGVGLGFFVGLLVPFGLQIVVVLPLAVLIKAAKIPTVACTWVTNHFTVFFIYPAQCVVGSFILGSPLSLSHVKTLFKTVLQEHSFSALSALGKEVLLSFFVGGFVFALVAAVPAYFVTLALVRGYRARKERRRQRNAIA